MSEKTKKSMEEIMEKLEAGVSECLDSDHFKNWLNVMSKFYHYSFNNSIMIAIQKPDATAVASFNKWKEMNRTVKKGEKGIQIIVPMKMKKDKLDSNGNIELDANGNPVQRTVTYFGKGYVFDVSQTEGADLPDICKELSFDVNDYYNQLSVLEDLSPVPIRFEDTGSDAKGYFSGAKNLIVIQPGMSEAQTIKTLIHEIAHARLGHGNKDCILTKDEKELQAEGVAYSVANYLGIDTGDYSFEYLASWTKSGDIQNLKAQMNKISECTKAFIEDINNALDKEADY